MERVSEDVHERPVTINQVVAWNIAFFRRTAQLTQKELGDLLGWSGAKVSEAERSWDGRRTREFNAPELADLSMALGVPVEAFFLPPEGYDCVFTSRARTGTQAICDMNDLMMRVVMSDSRDHSPAMQAYRERFSAAITSVVVERWPGLVAHFLGLLEDDTRARAELAAMFREREAAARVMTDDYGRLADLVDPETPDEATVQGS